MQSSLNFLCHYSESSHSADSHSEVLPIVRFLKNFQNIHIVRIPLCSVLHIMWIPLNSGVCYRTYLCRNKCGQQCKVQTANHTPLQVVLKPIYAYQSLVNRGEACNFEGWVGFGTGWAGLIGHQLGWVGPLKTHGLRAKFWARLWPDPVLVVFFSKVKICATTMITKVDHGNHCSNHCGYHNGN